jgi:methylamine utilization protein MauE
MVADGYATVGCVLLAGIMAFAAVSKIPGAEQAQLRTAITALTGAPAGRPARVLAVAAISTECLIAVLCLLPAGALAGPLLFVALMTGYLALTASGYARGVEVPCACFGRSTRELLRLRHVARNGLLLALGVGVVGRTNSAVHPGRPHLIMWIAIALVAAVSLAALLMSLAAFRRASSRPAGPAARTTAELSVDGVGLRAGDRLPEVSLTNTEGTTFTTRDYASGRLLAAFFVPNCPSCAESVDELARHAGRIELLAAVVGPAFRERDALVRRLKEAGVHNILVDHDAETLADLCQVDLFPTALYVEDGTVSDLAAAADRAR